MMLDEDISLIVDHHHNKIDDNYFRVQILKRFMGPGWEADGPPLPIPVKLIDVTIPAAVPVLSFKVLEDGRLKLFMKPGDGSSVVQLAVQLAFDRLAK
jgi:hypothetical protein